ncbi:unnamed protein product [Schistocephalus solidus]|uniref:LysM domain-containing protein n=1 Tax=Schistocephalus solidus TaxID=70667 RepID=A0A183TK17_SCHSO|nr:unnamed protein product [Schistocephalus solidus]
MEPYSLSPLFISSGFDIPSPPCALSSFGLSNTPSVGNISYAADLEREDFSRFLCSPKFEHFTSSFRDFSFQSNLDLRSSRAYVCNCASSALELKSVSSCLSQTALPTSSLLTELFDDLDIDESLKFTEWFFNKFRFAESLTRSFGDTDLRFYNLYRPSEEADYPMTRSTGCNTVNLSPSNADFGIQVGLEYVVQEPFEPWHTAEYRNVDLASDWVDKTQLKSYVINQSGDVAADKCLPDKNLLRYSNLSTLTARKWESNLPVDIYSVKEMDEIDGSDLKTRKEVKRPEQDFGRTIEIPIKVNANLSEMWFTSEITGTPTEASHTQHIQLSMHAPSEISSPPETDYEPLSNSSNGTNLDQEPQLSTATDNLIYLRVRLVEYEMREEFGQLAAITEVQSPLTGKYAPFRMAVERGWIRTRGGEYEYTDPSTDSGIPIHEAIFENRLKVMDAGEARRSAMMNSPLTVVERKSFGWYSVRLTHVADLQLQQWLSPERSRNKGRLLELNGSVWIWETRNSKWLTMEEAVGRGLALIEPVNGCGTSNLHITQESQKAYSVIGILATKNNCSTWLHPFEAMRTGLLDWRQGRVACDWSNSQSTPPLRPNIYQYPTAWFNFADARKAGLVKLTQLAAERVPQQLPNGIEDSVSFRLVDRRLELVSNDYECGDWQTDGVCGDPSQSPVRNGVGQQDDFCKPRGTLYTIETTQSIFFTKSEQFENINLLKTGLYDPSY